MKRIVFLLIIPLILAACSNDEQVTPNERFHEYVGLWNEQEYEELYPMLSQAATETYPEDQSTLRKEKIYQDLNVSDLQIEFQELNEEELELAKEEGTALIPFSVSMETIAGPISFDYEATLVQQVEDPEEETLNWYVEWDSGFIFPELQDGGEISIQTTYPKRGEILDRNEMPLAINDTIYEIGVVPGKLSPDTEQSIQQIADLLGMRVEAINNELSAGWVQDNLFVPLKNILPSDEALFADLMAINGVDYRENTGRIYPAGESAAHLVGYIRNITADDLEEVDPGQYGANDKIGSRGLEAHYEEQLKGKRGVKIVINQEGQDEILLAETPVENGENITVTIDVNVQEKLYNSYGEDAGTAAAVDPKTGETLALVSSPSFDPNEALYGTSGKYWEQLESDEQNPLINRFASTYAPGSVIKPVTGAIGLANGSIELGEGMEIEGLTWSNGEGWGNYEVKRVSTSNGPVDLADALIRSDNIFFARKAVEMESDSFVSGMQDFGIGEEFPYEYPITMSTISSSGNLDDEVLLANTSYGQGELEMSALHLAVTYTTFLNEGNMIKPTLLTSEETAQVWKEALISAEDAVAIQDALRKVVTEGTAKIAQEADFPISGKTGTAELKLTDDDESGENGWFVGYPTDDQDFIIAMMVEQIQDKESGLATRKVTDVLTQIK
ncbi:penicillin-binding transpeptidase domain-containing protein [Oceanobacillus saliphilus]|uniref:penicillin-binding transpeptidase domain-containing protein n=1 Tax=Oceanobacillus saliphilus TaxID=2925834 RepID=UPI00201DA972|nr:penicillin-binding transpeptidase domain-containing protein [Oceanobacillus saliphilus]